MDYNRKALSMWNGWSAGRKGIPVYDNWLDIYEYDLAKAGDEPILDLGCGIGADTRYLIEHGYNVLSVDYSRDALKSIDSYISGSRTMFLDMNEPFSLEDESFRIIVADISLHYFDREKTIDIMREIKRVLKAGGVLLARVSSINDTYYGAGSGREIEPRFYDHGSYAQRYFTEKDIGQFFGEIEKYTFEETAMTRDEAYYSRPKMLYQVRVEKYQEKITSLVKQSI